LSEATACICGQVFADEVCQYTSSGYAYADRNLLTEANGWISPLVVGLDPDFGSRGSAVAEVLGFLDNNENYGGLEKEWKRRLRDHVLT
jgi:hypothetical protein